MLEEADIAQSDVVVAMLRRDADNLAVALLARAAGVERVMVRMRDNAYRPVYTAAGIDRVAVRNRPDHRIGRDGDRARRDPPRHAARQRQRDRLRADRSSRQCRGRQTIMELAALPAFPSSCVFAALYQADGSVEAPRGSAVIQAGTTVLLVSRADEVARGGEDDDRTGPIVGLHTSAIPPESALSGLSFLK